MNLSIQNDTRCKLSYKDRRSVVGRCGETWRRMRGTKHFKGLKSLKKKNQLQGIMTCTLFIAVYGFTDTCISQNSPNCPLTYVHMTAHQRYFHKVSFLRGGKQQNKQTTPSQSLSKKKKKRKN